VADWKVMGLNSGVGRFFFSEVLAESLPLSTKVIICRRKTLLEREPLANVIAMFQFKATVNAISRSNYTPTFVNLYTK